MPAEASPDAFQYALKLLSGRQRSGKQLARRLRQQGFGPADVERAIKRLTNLNLLNDLAYAERFKEDWMQRRPGGRRLLCLELRKRGFGREIVQKLSEGVSDEDERKCAADVVERCRMRFRHLPPEKQKKRIYDSLLRRGFNFEIAHELTNTYDANE